MRLEARIGLAAVAVVAALSSTATVAYASAPKLPANSYSSVSRGVASPDLNPIVIGECNAGLGDTVISTYKSKKFGDIDLKCGDSKSGYVHIRTGKAQNWQDQINATGGSGNWDDLMDFSTRQAIEAPSSGYPKDEGGNKWCYTTPVQLYNDDGKLVKTIHPSIIISSNNHLVITSIPTSTTPSCKES